MMLDHLDATLVLLTATANSAALVLLVRDRVREKAKDQPFAATLVAKAGAEKQAADDMLQEFLAACTERNATANVPSSKLYEAFAIWCEQNGRPFWSHVAFSHAMLAAGYVKFHHDGVRWRGISLVRPEMDGGQ